MLLSIVIPAYNEAKRLPTTLQKIHLYLDTKLFEYEIIVIDDGSTDGTKDIVLNSPFSKISRLMLLVNERNRGKGFSIKRGIQAANGEYILFSDADLSAPIEEIDKLFTYVTSGFDIAIGSRSIKGAKIKVRQPLYRECMGKIFNLLVGLFVFRGIIDTQCGFKLFKAEVAKEIASEIKIDGFGFDVEMLYLATKKGYKIQEVPIVWINSPCSRVNPIIDSYKMFFELVNIKRLHNED